MTGYTPCPPGEPPMREFGRLAEAAMFGPTVTGRTSSSSAVSAVGAGTAPPPDPDPIMFRGVAGETTLELAPGTEAAPVGVLVELLAMAAAYIGPSPHIMVGNSRHPLLIWPLLFGNTGDGRKGEAHATARLVQPEDPEYRRLTVSGLSSGEGLIERVRDPDADPDEPTSGPAARRGGTDDKRLLIVETEFSSVMARAKREGNTLSAVLRQAWDGGALSVLTKSRSYASSSHIAIVGHVTPKEFRLRMAETELAGGTYNRFLPVYVTRSQRLPRPDRLRPARLAELRERIALAYRRAHGLTSIDLTPAAVDAWTELYEEFEPGGEDFAWTEFTQRASPYCLRLAALFAVLDGRRLVEPDDLAAAAGLVRYSINTAKHVLRAAHGDPNVDRVRQTLTAHTGEWFTRNTIRDLFSRHLPAKALDEVLTELLADPAFEFRTESTGGRPATAYRRRPTP